MEAGLDGPPTTHAYTISLLTLFSCVDTSRVISFVISPIVPFHSLLLIQAVLSLLSYYSYTIPFSIVELVLSAALPSLLSYYSFCFSTVIAFTIVLILTARQLLFLTAPQFLLLLQFLLFDSYCFITVLILTALQFCFSIVFAFRQFLLFHSFCFSTVIALSTVFAFHSQIALPCSVQFSLSVSQLRFAKRAAFNTSVEMI